MVTLPIALFQCRVSAIRTSVGWLRLVGLSVPSDWQGGASHRPVLWKEQSFLPRGLSSCFLTSDVCWVLEVTSASNTLVQEKCVLLMLGVWCSLGPPEEWEMSLRPRPPAS
jgi:hypothetical protein